MIEDKTIQRAEICTYYGKYDEAEALFRKLERQDLMVQLRERTGDWFKVVEMIREGTGLDQKLQNAYDKIGAHFADIREWRRAADFYTLSKNYVGMIDNFYNLEDYDSVAKLIPILPEGDKALFMTLGAKLQSVGMCDAAVKCFEKAGDPKRALDCCVVLNEWQQAVELAE